MSIGVIISFKLAESPPCSYTVRHSGGKSRSGERFMLHDSSLPCHLTKIGIVRYQLATVSNSVCPGGYLRTKLDSVFGSVRCPAVYIGLYKSSQCEKHPFVWSVSKPHHVLQCYIGDKPFLWSKAKFDLVTLYSFNRSLPNLVWLITSATPTHMLIFVEFG